MTTMTDARAVEVLAAMREDGGVVADADYTAAIDRAIARLREPAEAQPDPSFAEWLATEMPAGTVIGDPAWWANRIARQYAKRSSPAQAQGGGDVYGYEHDGRYWSRDGATPWVIHHAVPLYTAPPSAPVGMEDVEVLKRLRAALPDVGLNGWFLGVEVLGRVIDALAQQPAAVDGAMVERAEAAATEYWQDESHATRCDKCNGTGEDRSVSDWCGACGGQGHYHAGTETGAMRAALIAALAAQPSAQGVG